jgi:LytTr DNA-binding domain
MTAFIADLAATIFRPMQLFIAVALALLLSVAGPFGTLSAMSFIERLVYWAAVVAISIFGVQAMKALVATRLRRLGYWQNALLVCIGSAAVLGPVLRGLSVAMTGDKREYLTPLWLITALVFSIVLMIFALRSLMRSAPDARQPRLFSRFGDPKVKTIFRITVRDHYVDVYTNRGKETLLLRFSDALAELDGWPGQRVHRSHWVADVAVQAFRKQNGRAVVVLRDGSEIPVSRGYQEEVEAQFSRQSARARRAAPVRS